MRNPFRKRPDPNKCQQCEKPAVMQFGQGQALIHLCVDCSLKWQQAIEMSQRRNAEIINYLTAQMESTVGMYGMFPRFKMSTPVIHKGDIKLNNINVNNSTVGAINTGTIESIDVNLTIMKNSEEPEVVQGFKELTEQLIQSKELDASQKNEILDKLAFISEQLSKPREARKRGIVMPIIESVGVSLSTISHLLSIWEKLRKIIDL